MTNSGHDWEVVERRCSKCGHYESDLRNDTTGCTPPKLVTHPKPLTKEELAKFHEATLKACKNVVKNNVEQTPILYKRLKFSSLPGELGTDDD